MSFREFCYLFLSISFSAVGQFCLKLGAEKLAKLSGINVWERILIIFFTPELIIGLGCYGVGAIAYILLLSRVDLSMAAPAVSLVYVFSVMLGYFWFNETIPLSRAIGLGMVMLGVALITWK